MKIKLFFLFLFLVLPIVLSSIDSQEINTHVIVNIVDENNNFVDGPIIIFVKIIPPFDGFIEEYAVFIDESGQSIAAPWNPLFYTTGTTVEFIATKDGYQNSEVFTFVISDNTPLTGLLFEHTFVLDTLSDLESERTTQFIENIMMPNKNFEVEIVTTSEFHNMNFNSDLKILTINLEEDSSDGFIKLTFSKLFMSGPFRVIIDNNRGIFQIEETFEQITLHIKYSQGSHNIEINSQNIFEPGISVPILLIESSSSEITLDEPITISGSISPIQPRASINLELTGLDGEIIFRTIPIFADGTFQFIFNPEQLGDWSVVGKYEFNNEIVTSNTIIFTVIELQEPRAPSEEVEPSPEQPAPEQPEPEEPEQKPEEQKEPESKPVEERPVEESEISSVGTNQSIFILIVVLLLIGGSILYLKQEQKNREKSKKSKAKPAKLKELESKPVEERPIDETKIAKNWFDNYVEQLHGKSVVKPQAVKEQVQEDQQDVEESKKDEAEQEREIVEKKIKSRVSDDDSVDDNKQFCINCGNKKSENANFCEKCGAKF